MSRYIGAKCFVVSVLKNGIYFYLKRFNVIEEATEGEGLPVIEGRFIPDLKEALKFPTEADAQALANRFEGARVEIIKTGEVLK